MELVQIYLNFFYKMNFFTYLLELILLFLDFSLLDPDSGDQCGSMRIPYPQPWFLVIPNILDILVGKTNGHICAPVCWCL